MITPSTLRSLLACTLLALLGACAQTYQVDTQAVQNAQLANFNTPESMIFASGQPTPEQLQTLSAAGVRHVVSLRRDSEIDWDERAAVEAAGMRFHNIPVAGRMGVTPENAEALEMLLADLQGQPVLLHCGTSNRVGALKAMTAHQNGASIDAAVAEGRRWGLTGMENTVREVLAEQ